MPTHPNAPIAKPITLWRRTLCLIYESLMVFSLLVFFGYAFSASTQFKGTPGTLRWMFQGWLILILALYFSWFWSHNRRTLPMKTLEMRVVDTHGNPIGYQRACARFLVAVLCLIGPLAAARYGGSAWLLLYIAPGAMAILDRQKRAPHGWLSGTRLVYDASRV